jgi:hypothetical protein
MKPTIKRLLVLGAALAVFSFQALPAQAQSSTTHIKRNMAAIMFAGLGGAVLGASTLSFYGSPSDHTGNIWMGLGVGLIAGATYVIYREAQAPAVDYGKVQWPTNPSQMLAAQKHFNIYNYKFEF